jgi:hypothetical protein
MKKVILMALLAAVSWTLAGAPAQAAEMPRHKNVLAKHHKNAQKHHNKNHRKHKRA